MFKFHKYYLGVMAAVAAIVASLIFWWAKSLSVVEPDGEAAPALSSLSIMAEPPDWSLLDQFQQTITRSDFEHLLGSVFTAGDQWREWIQISDEGADIRANGDEWYRMAFAPVNRDIGDARYWREASQLPMAPPGRPLQGLRIAIDPGHIGGAWAKMEERWLSIGDADPICEGDMTLMVAKLLKPRLEGLGAKVILVREHAEPVTNLRPADFLDEAMKSSPNPDRAQRLADRWFYRTAEIRARAKLVNEVIKPDLVLCLHFNADAWGDPRRPQLVDGHHVHLLVHGAYGDDEVAFEDQRYAMIEKLLSGVHPEESSLAGSIGQVFSEATQMPMFKYSLLATHVRRVDGKPGLWARNLLANRLYQCPVVFLEPYVMNSKLDFPRMQAGDFLGLCEINGRKQISIFREYAEVVVAGLVRHCNEQREHVD